MCLGCARTRRKAQHVSFLFWPILLTRSLHSLHVQCQEAGSASRRVAPRGRDISVDDATKGTRGGGPPFVPKRQQDDDGITQRQRRYLDLVRPDQEVNTRAARVRITMFGVHQHRCVGVS